MVGPLCTPILLFSKQPRVVETFQTLRAGMLLHEPPIGIPTPFSRKAPPLGWYKANWDAGVNRKKGRLGLGAVIWDHQGRMWASKSLTCHGFLDPTTAETMAATMAVQLCYEMGIMQVHLEGDAKNVVDDVNSMVLDESDKGHLMEDIRVALISLLAWEMGYVR